MYLFSVHLVEPGWSVITSLTPLTLASLALLTVLLVGPLLAPSFIASLVLLWVVLVPLLVLTVATILLETRCSCLAGVVLVVIVTEPWESKVSNTLFSHLKKDGTSNEIFVFIQDKQH